MADATDVYAFIPTADNRHPTDVSVVNDNDSTQAAIQYANDKVGAGVTDYPDSPDTHLADAYPRRFYVERVPITPRIGNPISRTINVYGDSVARPLINANRNRRSLRVWTDIGNTAGIYVGTSQNVAEMVGFAPACLAFNFESCDEFFVWAATNGILYMVEESYLVNEHGR